MRYDLKESAVYGRNKQKLKKNADIPEGICECVMVRKRRWKRRKRKQGKRKKGKEDEGRNWVTGGLIYMQP